MFKLIINSMRYGFSVIRSKDFDLTRMFLLPCLLCMASLFLRIVVLSHVDDPHNLMLIITHLPSMIAGGILTVNVSHYTYFRHMTNTNQVINGQLRAIDAKAGVIFYALVFYLAAGLLSFISMYMPQDMNHMNEATEAELNLQMFLALILILVLFNMKYLWLCIPISFGKGLKESIVLYKGNIFSYFVLFLYFSLLFICFIIALIPLTIIQSILSGAGIIGIFILNMLTELLQLMVLALMSASITGHLIMAKKL